MADTRWWEDSEGNDTCPCHGPLSPCPHGDDESHGGLGRAWCLAGREGAAYVAAREARIAALAGVTDG